ncbi:hypothetical protein CRUP_005621 [Coryphaenoides rupestris]|nr:hypothetical protein CRUP_005621 [Coryphaenoides rupestris]
MEDFRIDQQAYHQANHQDYHQAYQHTGQYNTQCNPRHIWLTCEQNILSYDDKTGPLGKLDPLYMGRASLFQINEPNGDASLRLKSVSIQDEGMYTCSCFTLTTTEMKVMEINLTVIGEIK